MDRNLFYEQLQKESESKPNIYANAFRWEQIHQMIDDAMRKRDRYVSIFLSPDGGMSVDIYPYPDDEEGKIDDN